MTDDYTNLDRARDAVANSDWMDTGNVDPYTIAEGYAFFDRVIRKVQADAFAEGFASCAYWWEIHHFESVATTSNQYLAEYRN